MSVEQKMLIKNLFNKILVATEKVCLLLRYNDEYFLWLDDRAEQRLDLRNPIERFHYVLQLFTLHHQQKAKTVLFCPGFIAAPPPLYEAILELNAAKKTFQDSMVALRKELLKIKEATLDNQFGNPSHERPQIVHQFLVDIGLEHLHFKHVYRCLPVLDFTPAQLGWTWAHTQSIKTITQAQAIALLQKRNKEGRFDNDIEKINQLAPEVTLSIRQKLAPHLRINVVDREGHRSMLKGTLPIVFPRDKELPLIRPAREPHQDQQPRAVRKDRLVGNEPFIPAIRAHISKAKIKTEEKVKEV
jgi:hypothetical protein